MQVVGCEPAELQGDIQTAKPLASTYLQFHEGSTPRDTWGKRQCTNGCSGSKNFNSATSMSVVLSKPLATLINTTKHEGFQLGAWIVIYEFRHFKNNQKVEMYKTSMMR